MCPHQSPEGFQPHTPLSDFAALTRIELATPSLTGWCSNHLSYKTLWSINSRAVDGLHPDHHRTRFRVVSDDPFLVAETGFAPVIFGL